VLSSLELLKRVHDGGAEFVLIGGMAAIAHGSGVVTHDLDLCAPLDLPSVQKIIRSLQDLHPRWRTRPDLPEITPDNHNLPGIKNLYLRTDIGPMDVLGEVPEVCSYAELAGKAVEMDFEGIRCRVIDIDTLIAAKTAANRPKDHETIRHLRAIKAERGRP
jgi:predicted nucleotidyltransferase